MSLDLVLNDLFSTAHSIESALTGPNSIMTRLSRIEHSLYNGAGEGLIITSASIANILKSTNFATGSTGWQIQKSGVVEFAEATVRGTIYASAGEITGTLYVGTPSDRIIIDGSAKTIASENYSAGSAGWQTSYDGTAEFNNVTVRGGVYASSGSFTGGITIGSGGSFSSGQTDYDTGTGFWLEYNSGTPRFSMGDGSTNAFKWNGTTLEVTNLTVNGAFDLNTGSAIKSGQTAYDTGSGFWMEYNGGTPRFSIGDGSSNKLTWDGSALTVSGLTVTGSTLTGSLVVSTGGSISSGQTSYDDGTGFWMAYNGGTPQLSIGNSAGNKLTWDGSLLSITGTMQSSDFVTGVSGWKIDEGGTAEFQDIIARGTIKSTVFEYDEVSATSGSQLIVPAAGVLVADVTIPAAPTTCNVDIKDPSSAHTQLFTAGDVLRIKDGTNDSWLTISSVSDQTTFYRYVCVLSSGSEATYYAGSAVLDYGQSGDGAILQSADDTNGPFISVFTHSGSPWSATTEAARIGNLNGWGAFVSDRYGWAVGTYAGGSYIYYDPVTNITKMVNGGGATVFDDDGIKITQGTNDANHIKWMDSARIVTYVEGYSNGSTDSYTVSAGAFTSSTNAQVTHYAISNASSTIQKVTTQCETSTSANSANFSVAIVADTLNLELMKCKYSSTGNWGTFFNAGVRIGATAGASTLPAQGYLWLHQGTSINEFSIDDTLAGDSDDAVPTEQAVKAYVDNKHVYDQWIVRAQLNLVSKCKFTNTDVTGSDFRLKWTSAASLDRIIAIPLGRDSTNFTTGHLSFYMPAVSTVITGYGGSAGDTVTADGILINAFEALYGVFDGPTDSDVSFALLDWSSNFTVPNNWIFIAGANSDGTNNLFVNVNGGFQLDPDTELDFEPGAPFWTESNVAARDAADIGSGSGTAGYRLTADGSGNSSWSKPAASNGDTYTVAASGGDSTTIQGAIDLFDGQLVANGNITVEAGTYNEKLTLANCIVLNELELVITGDSRSLAGFSYIDGHNANQTSVSGLGSGAVTLSNSGTTLTIACASTNPTLTDYGNGDTVMVYDNSGTWNTMTISSVATNVLTFTATAPTVGNAGTSVTFIPNRTITAPANYCVDTYTSLHLKGFNLLPVSSAVYLREPITVKISNCVVDGQGTTADGYYMSVPGTFQLNAPNSVIRCDRAIELQGPGYVNAPNSFYGIDCTYGILAVWGGYCNGYQTQWANCTYSVNAGSGGLINANSAWTTNSSSYGFYASYTGYMSATSSSGRATGNSTDYSPATSGVEGNVDGIIYWS